MKTRGAPRTGARGEDLDHLTAPCAHRGCIQARILIQDRPRLIGAREVGQKNSRAGGRNRNNGRQNFRALQQDSQICRSGRDSGRHLQVDLIGCHRDQARRRIVEPHLHAGRCRERYK